MIEQRLWRALSPRHRAAAALAVLTLLGAVARLWKLTRNPPSIDQDEAVGGYDAFCILHTLRDHHGNFLPVAFESFEDWVSPLLTYLTVPFVALFGLSESTIRLPVALAGTACVPLVFVLVRQLGGHAAAALGAAAIFALSPWHVPLSRWAIPPSILPFAMLVACVAFFWALRATGRGQWLRWCAFVAAAAAWTYSYPTQKLFAPLAVLTMLTIHLWRRRIAASLIWVAYVAAVAPMYLLVLRDPVRYNARFNMMALPVRDVFKRPQVIADVVARYVDYLSPDFYFGRGDTNLTHHIQPFGAITPLAAPFFYLALVALAMVAVGKLREVAISRKNAAILVLLFLLAPLPSAIVHDRLQLNRTVHALPLVMIIAVIGLAMAVAWMQQAAHQRIVIGAVLAVFAAESAASQSLYWDRTRIEARGDFQYGLRKPFIRAIADEWKYDEVHVNGHINQPYIFYLFYSQKDPKTLNYAEINANARGDGNWLWVDRIGKWHFRDFAPGELDGARLLMQEKTRDQVWHRLFAKDRHLYLE